MTRALVCRLGGACVLYDIRATVALPGDGVRVPRSGACLAGDHTRCPWAGSPVAARSCGCPCHRAHHASRLAR
jgi:hypothetical protein